MIYFVCAPNDLLPIVARNVRWLEKDTDYELAKSYWQERGQVLSNSTWDKAHEYGYQYAAIIECNKIVSSAGVWRFSENWWDIVAAGTLKNYRRRGFSKSIVAFITSYVHKSGRLATGTTRDDNLAAITTAKSVGFHQVPETRVWWRYPRLPDF